jgi:hypothetical protein
MKIDFSEKKRTYGIRGKKESRPTLRAEMLLWQPAPVNPKTALPERQTVPQGRLNLRQLRMASAENPDF